MSEVSILMPVRNASAFLHATLDSIIEQSLREWEFIMVDDHSQDESPSIMKDYALKDQRINVLENKGKGIISALQCAYEASKSPLITRMDADDLMALEKLKALKAASRPGHVATAKVSYFREDAPLAEGFKRYADWLNSLIDEKSHWKEIYKECVIPSPCWMMHREDLESIGAFRPERYPEDYDLVFRMYEAGLKVASVDKVLHHWRDHSDRASRNDPNYQDNRFLNLKLHYYLKCDYSTACPLVLWGAGTKGKRLANMLIEKNIDFTWVTDNAKKWKAPILGKSLIAPSQILANSQVIIAVAAGEHQMSIRQQLDDLEPRAFHFFC